MNIMRDPIRMEWVGGISVFSPLCINYCMGQVFTYCTCTGKCRQFCPLEVISYPTSVSVLLVCVSLFLGCPIQPQLQLRVTFDECEAEFSSKDASHTIPELDQQLRETSDKKVFMEQAIGVVLSQGSKARGLIAPKTSPNTRGIVGQKSFPPASGDAQPRDELSMSLNLPDGMSRAQSSEYLSENPKLTVSNSSHASEDDLSLNLASSKGELEVSLPQIRPRSQNLKSPKSKGKGKHTRTKSWDLLDSRDIDLKNKNSGDEGLKTPTQDLPKLLVSPKRTSKSSLKSAQSLQSISETDKDRKMLEGYLDEVKGRLDRLLVLWEERKGMLEEARKALEFLEAAPEIFDWLNADGAGFIAKYDTYGRSIEEVCSIVMVTGGISISPWLFGFFYSGTVQR